MDKFLEDQEGTANCHVPHLKDSILNTPSMYNIDKKKSRDMFELNVQGE